MEAKTSQEFFDKILRSKFRPDRAKGINVTVQVNISGPKGGDWTVDIKEEKMQIRNGNYDSPDLTIGMADSDFLDLVNDRLNVQKAFFTGKIRFKGDIGLALRLKDTGFL